MPYILFKSCGSLSIDMSARAKASQFCFPAARTNASILCCVGNNQIKQIPSRTIHHPRNRHTPARDFGATQRVCAYTPHNRSRAAPPRNNGQCMARGVLIGDSRYHACNPTSLFRSMRQREDPLINIQISGFCLCPLS